MTPHPQFRKGTSRCTNCLAFQGDSGLGTCRLHAPMPMPIISTLHDDLDFVEQSCQVISEEEPARWPTVVSLQLDDDERVSWCLDWLPNEP